MYLKFKLRARFFDGVELLASFLEVAEADDIFYYLNYNLLLCPSNL